jgi:hypothetical protein
MAIRIAAAARKKSVPEVIEWESMAITRNQPDTCTTFFVARLLSVTSGTSGCEELDGSGYCLKTWRKRGESNLLTNRRHFEAQL